MAAAADAGRAVGKRFVLPAAIRSLTVFMFDAAGTISTSGADVTMVIGAKSAIGS